MKLNMLLLLLASAISCMGCGEDIKSEDHLIYNRVWESHSAISDRDLVNNVIFAEGKSGIGIFEQTSYYHNESDLFIHERTNKDNQMRINHLQRDTTYTVSVIAWTCNKGEYKYCLKIYPAPQGSSQYYSNDGMEVDTSSLKMISHKKNPFQR